MIDDAQGFRERMACLADQSRFRIVLALAGAEQCVSALAREVGLSQSCTTRHLQALSRRGLVRGSRRGKQVIFSVCLDAREIRWVVESGPEGSKGSGPADSRGPVSGKSRRTSRPVTRRAASRERPEAPVVIELGHPEAMDLPGPPEPEPDYPPAPLMRRSDLEDYLL